MYFNQLCRRYVCCSFCWLLGISVVALSRRITLVIHIPCFCFIYLCLHLWLCMVIMLRLSFLSMVTCTQSPRFQICDIVRAARSRFEDVLREVDALITASDEGRVPFDVKSQQSVSCDWMHCKHSCFRQCRDCFQGMPSSTVVKRLKLTWFLCCCW